MTDDPGLPPEELLIDARSPGERWAESGRAGFERARALVESGRLDLAALVWMACIVGLTALQVYSALRLSGFDNGVGGLSTWWTKAQFLAESGGILLSFGSLIGVFLAAWSDRPAARAALRIATGAGVWVILAGLLGIAAAIHSGQGNIIPFGPSGAEAKIVASLGEFGYMGLGLVVAVVSAILTGASASEDPALS